jgi:hypothetical protein
MATGMTNAGASVNLDPIEPTIVHMVTTIDPFGIVDEQFVEHGANAIVPTPRTHDLLTFEEYNQSYENVTEDRVIGAIYRTTDNKTYIFVTVNSQVGLTVYVTFANSGAGTIKIDWGDGTEVQFALGGSNQKNKTYTIAGEYVITMEVMSGAPALISGRVGQSHPFVGYGQAPPKTTLTATKILLSSHFTTLGVGSFTLGNLDALSLPTTISSILDAAFRITGLKYLSLPANISMLNNDLFSASFLKLISFSNIISLNNNTHFNETRSLQMISDLNNISDIPANFMAFSSVKKIHIESATTIGDYAFNYNRSLEEIFISPNIQNIGRSSFSNNNSLKKINIFNVKVVGIDAFRYSTSLEKIEIGNYLETIGNYAFSGCSNVENVTIQSCLTMGDYVFSSNPKTISVTLGAGVKNIGNYAFLDNYNLKTINLNEGLITIGNGAFKNNYLLEEIKIPNSVTSYGTLGQIFYNCTNIKKIEFGTGAAIIPTNMFYQNYLLEEVIFPEGVITVLSSFDFSYSLKKIVYPSTIQNCGPIQGIYNASGLYCPLTIIIYAEIPPVISNFTNVKTTKVYVPDSSVSAYKVATNWTLISDMIFPLSTYVQ